MTFEEAVAAYRLGLLLPEFLPEVATDALCSGLESPSLAALAGESPKAASPSELHEMFRTALRELGVVQPDIKRAGEILRDYHARRVVSGDVTAYQGAKAIVESVLPCVDGTDVTYVGEALGVAKLVAVFYEYDLVHEGLATEDAIKAAIVEECRRILGLSAA